MHFHSFGVRHLNQSFWFPVIFIVSIQAGFGAGKPRIIDGLTGPKRIIRLARIEDKTIELPRAPGQQAQFRSFGSNISDRLISKLMESQRFIVFLDGQQKQSMAWDVIQSGSAQKSFGPRSDSKQCRIYSIQSLERRSR